MRRLVGSGFFVLLLLLLDWYVFQAIRVVSSQSTSFWQAIIYSGYWSLSILTVLSFYFFRKIKMDHWPRFFRTYSFAILIGLFLSKLVASLFFLTDDIRRVVQWAGTLLFDPGHHGLQEGNSYLSRSVFLSWLGLGMGGTLFGTFIIGFRNKYRYQVERLSLKFDQLPKAFKGLKLVHISDIHSGSFTNRDQVEKGIQKILDEKPDLILFTGDLVNNRSEEMDEFVNLFGRLEAPLGVFSVLGNHDYGDYHRWPSLEAKRENLERLMAIQDKMGWRLLMNEHVVFEKQGQQIALLGIENWSAKGNFSQYGKLEDAYEGTEPYPFKILMSHDPTHWDAEIRKDYPDINLTLSGHTHGMQFGLNLPGFRWSPAQYIYKQWAGLYDKGNQKLYVNRGFGFIGYPGRVGILPEITVIELI